MSSLSIDEKMMLVQKMRSQSEHNTESMHLRRRVSEPLNERIVSENGTNYIRGEFMRDAQEETGGLSYLKLRIFVSIFIFALFFSFYQTKFNLMGHQAKEIHAVLEENILPKKLQDSLETLSSRLLAQ